MTLLRLKVISDCCQWCMFIRKIHLAKRWRWWWWDSSYFFPSFRFKRFFSYSCSSYAPVVYVKCINNKPDETQNKWYNITMEQIVKFNISQKMHFWHSVFERWQIGILSFCGFFSLSRKNINLFNVHLMNVVNFPMKKFFVRGARRNAEKLEPKYFSTETLAPESRPRMEWQIWTSIRFEILVKTSNQIT